jgi:hypothetical protein
MSRHATHGERHQWPSHVGPPRACERRRWPSDVALQAFARRREEEKGACEVKNKGPTRCCYRQPCVPPPQGPYSLCRRSAGPAHRTAAPRVLHVTPPPHGPCSSRCRSVGPAHCAAAPRPLLITPPPRWSYTPHRRCSSRRRSACPGPPRASHLATARRERESEYREEKLEKKKDRRSESEYVRR